MNDNEKTGIEKSNEINHPFVRMTNARAQRKFEDSLLLPLLNESEEKNGEAVES